MNDFNINISQQMIEDKLIGLGFLVRNPSLINFRLFRIASHYPTFDKNLNIDISATFSSKLLEDMISNITKYISNELMTKLDSFLDLRGLQHIPKIKKMSEDLKPINHHNMMSNSRIIVDIQDSPLFHNIGGINTMNSQIYSVGTFNHHSVYVDAYLPHKDYRIAFFDDIEINVGCVRLIDGKSPDIFHDKIMLEVEFDFKLNNKHIIGVMDEMNNDALGQYRETKIDSVLNGDI